jgi:hypothetical protein
VSAAVDTLSNLTSHSDPTGRQANVQRAGSHTRTLKFRAKNIAWSSLLDILSSGGPVGGRRLFFGRPETDLLGYGPVGESDP